MKSTKKLTRKFILLPTPLSIYRDFQYRFLVNAIHTNIKLYYWKKVPSKIFEYCNNEVQNVKHLFFTCEKTSKIWEKYEEFISQQEITEATCLEFNWKNIALNKVHPKAEHVFNYTVLIIKQAIYAHKCLGKNLDFPQIISQVVNTYRFVKYNSNEKSLNTKNTKHGIA